MGEESKRRQNQELLDKLEQVGDSSRYVWKLFLLCMVPSILNGLNVTSYVYLTDVPDHWCHVSELDNTSWTHEQILQITSPSNQSTCEYYDLDYASLAQLSFEDALANSTAGDRKLIPCKSIEFDPDISSMVSDFDLVCERTVFKPTIQVAISLGKFLGAFLFGIVSDKYGRKVSFLCGSILYIAAGPLIAFANSYGMVIVGRIALGAAGSGIYHSAYVILTEIVSKRRRASLGIVYNMSYPIGQMVVPVIAYFIRDWRTLQIVLSVPAVFILLFWWFLPESPMWQLSKQQKEKAAVFIEKHYAQLNHKQEFWLSKTASAEKMNDVAEEPSLVPDNQPQQNLTMKQALWEKLKLSFDQLYQLLRYGELRCRLAIAFFTWCVCSFSYYGLALNTDNFETDRYVYGFLTGLVEAPSYLLPLPLLRYMGRRYTTIILFFVGGVALLLILTLPETQGLNVPLLVVASIGRLCVSGVFAVVILHTSEMFPTLLRNTAIGIGSTASHVGSMSAPLFVDLAGAYFRFIPSTVFGFLAIMAGCLTFLLPETKNKPLPNSLDDIIKGSKETKVGFHQVCSSPKNAS